MNRLIAVLLALLLAGAPMAAAAQPAGPTLGQVMQAAERDDAAALARDWNNAALIEQIKAIGPDALIDYYVGVGRAFDRMGRTALAAQAYDAASQAIWDFRGPGHFSHVEVYRALAADQMKLKKYLDAVWNADQAAEIARNSLGDDPLTTALEKEAADYSRRALAAGADFGGEGDTPPGAGPDQKPFQLVDIFYATDRKATAAAAPARYFSGQRGPMAYGKATISVPSRRQVGEIPVPSIFTLQLKPDPEKHFILTSVSPISTRDGFFGQVGEAVGRSREKEAFVFVHGFNSSFENAALRTAQLAADLKFDGAPILYSWPSRGDVFGYADDARESESALEAQAFADFLNDVATRTGADRITIIAHSMGNRVLLNALQRIAPPAPGAPVPFDEIVMAAPDVGVDAFEAAWPRARQVGGRFTLYASSRDKALQMSAQINGMRRLGDAHQIVVADGLESIDTTAASSGLIGHDDFAGTALDDFRAVVWLSLAPGRRCVLQSGGEGHRWWLFGGACATADFTAATTAARLAGGPKAALDQVEQQLPKAQGPVRDSLARLRDMLSKMGAE
jgi:esterase/lipase superfamily enzyme